MVKLLMEYQIVHLPQRGVAMRQRRYVKTLAKLFHEEYLLKKKDPAHISIKYPFPAANISDVECILENITKKHLAPDVAIRRYISFHNRVLCWKVDFSTGANKIYDELRRELRKLTWLKWERRDIIKGKFHVALLFTSSLESFRNARAHLAKEKPDFHLKLHTLTIRKRSRKGVPWKVHKTYRFR